jgi:hypothetical protein
MMGGHSAYPEPTVHCGGQTVILRLYLQYNKSKRNWFNRCHLQYMKQKSLQLIHTGVFKISVLICAPLLIRVRQRTLIKGCTWKGLQNNRCCTTRRGKKKYRRWARWALLVNRLAIWCVPFKFRWFYFVQQFQAAESDLYSRYYVRILHKKYGAFSHLVRVHVCFS